jgi:predicted metal-dependent phosphoesterase TrpH
MIDLHSHSVFSDGSETPERVVELAYGIGCSAVALTDHDGLGGIGQAESRAAALGIEFVPGCEVSCVFSPGTMHVLCYFVRDEPGPLQDELVRLRRDRSERNTKLVERLHELGIPIDFTEVERIAKGSVVGRPHFAQALVEIGAATSINDAFEQLLGKGQPAYVSKARVDAAEIVDLTRRSGGVAVLAHPLSLGLSPNELAKEVDELRGAGLSGLESYYSRYDSSTRAELVALARRAGLVPTGGSDFHGSYKPDLSMGTGTGDLRVPDDVLVELESRRP